jgi:hypothetical protein
MQNYKTENIFVDTVILIVPEIVIVCFNITGSKQEIIIILV